jgi:hypothetical protein
MLSLFLFLSESYIEQEVGRDNIAVGRNGVQFATPPTAGTAGIGSVGVSPQQDYKKQTSFGGLITRFAGIQGCVFSS